MRKNRTGEIRLTELYTTLLHEHKELTSERAQKCWNIILETSDGVKVESLREQYELTNTPKDILRIIRRQRYVTKSKLGSFGFDHKQFQIGYMFGFSGEQNEAMRKGTNMHIVQEELPTYLDNDEILNYYNRNGSIAKYISNKAKDVFLDIISNAVNKDISNIEKALETFPLTESRIYRRGIRIIGLDYDYRFKKIASMRTPEESLEFLIPAWREVVLWDDKEWTNGILDALFKDPFWGHLPVDYKFGNPKENYYIPAIGLEMTFYEKLVSGQNTLYAFDYTSERKKWKPLYCKYGEMWYMLDTENKAQQIQFSSKWNVQYHKAIMDYWDAMNDMDYAYQPYYGYRSDRFTDFCEGGRFQCELRKICEKSDSFRLHNDDDDSFIDKILEEL